ncbi:DotD/TraH family lipoprotein [Chromobacterium sp. IIBBL 290-4]|uniref:DotD/TraH family lipoprotein n=1 Tax=Chromobacterium sp. IIBBL 290-4 TaxID=2953890 RepID=UPI0020B754E4|nr:DotD/TraH family lipoprotein [Chromobacterium sp. IIBBL 290-4]UTH74140.1 DotD/TraH family lipoprotein [Chromobacterium sp. IIBBL 290-4]
MQVDAAEQTLRPSPPSALPAADSNLDRLYSTEYEGPPGKLLGDLARITGWRFEERGAADPGAVVRIKSLYQPVIAILRSIGEQFPYALVADQRSQTILLDYTRLIIASPPSPQPYLMDGGVFSSRAAAERAADSYKNKGLSCQIKKSGRTFQILIGPFNDDGAGERKVKDMLGPLKRLPPHA